MALIKISTENITAEERRRIELKGNMETYFDVRYETHGEIRGKECVDLGLLVKWATCNVGADSL